MTTALISHPACLQHAPPAGHPECPERLEAVLTALEAERFTALLRVQASRADPNTLGLVHGREMVEAVFAATSQAQETNQSVAIDSDTIVSAGSEEAALRAVGAVMDGIDLVMSGKATNAFCAVRPPGHHAEPGKAMGFCLFNSVAIGAAYAREKYGLKKIAVVDFDVHHGNGTEAAFETEPDFFYVSTHQFPLYPGTGARDHTGAHNNILNLPLPSRADSDTFREALAHHALPALARFKPDFLLISAGFDAHKADPLANLELTEDDFAWATQQLMKLAEESCQGRIVSSLEGGYDLLALGRSAAAHVSALMGHE